MTTCHDTHFVSLSRGLEYILIVLSSRCRVGVGVGEGIARNLEYSGFSAYFYECIIFYTSVMCSFLDSFHCCIDM